MRPRMSDPSQPLPRASLAATCLAHAACFAWAGSSLPWRSGTIFALLATLLALLHLATGVTALLRKPIWLVWVWRALSASSGLAFVIFVWSAAAAALYVSKLYPRLGPPVAGGILLGALLLSALTLPMAIWGARRTWPAQFRAPRGLGIGGSLIGGLFVLTLPLASSAAENEQVRLVSSKVTSELSKVLENYTQIPANGPSRSVAGAAAASCSEPITPERLTLLVAYVTRKGWAASACLQGQNPRELRRALNKLLGKKARAGSTVVLDLVKSVKALSATLPVLDALEVRPGLDGVCEDGRCLPAWQLTLSDAFSENHPLASIPEASYGFSSELTRKALGTADGKAGRGIEGLLRIETESLSADANGVHQLVRTRATPPALSADGIAQAVAAAQSFILEAQEKDGTFRYALDPTTGAEDRATLNLPRQAGTTYALCELGYGRPVNNAIQRALAAFEPKETQFGDVSALQDAGEFGLGKSALPLLAMLRCRSLAGTDRDRLIGQLSRLMLKLQRENGSFYPVLDPATKRGQGVHEVMYAAGQAVLALVLLEQQLDSLKGSAAEPLPSPGVLKSALDRAMAFYAGPYWPKPLRDFFFFEEGWHCQAARHALTSHRNDGYEQLCLDYVASRLRFVARKADTSEPNFVGGYALGDLFPPSNTATSGVGEALDAAITIKKKRGLPLEADKAILRDLVTFLLRAQWSEAGCYACRTPSQVVGGFSQQLASPSIRIDYVQHAMSAIGHGGELLF